MSELCAACDPKQTGAGTSLVASSVASTEPNNNLNRDITVIM